MAFRRRAALPASVLARIGVPRDERVLGWAVGPGEAPGEVLHVLATDRAVYAAEPVGPGRVPWDLVVRATWDEPMLELVAQARPGARARRWRIVLNDPRDLADAVRAQVTASVLVQQRLDLGLADGLGATAVARRVADTGHTRWSVSFDKGIDSRDPEVRAAADRALAELRAGLGL